MLYFLYIHKNSFYICQDLLWTQEITKCVPFHPTAGLIQIRNECQCTSCAYGLFNKF